MNESINCELVKYWTDYSEFFLENLQDNPTSNFDTIHVIAIQILDEIKFNNFKSKENKKYLLSMIGKVVKEDFIAEQLLNDDLRILITKFQNNNVTFVENICKDILKQFDNGNYYVKICENFSELFITKECTDEAKEKIKFLGKVFIIELILCGNDIVSIKKVIKKFNEYIVNDESKSLEYLKSIFNITTTVVNFQIRGLIGKCDIKFGNINIYNPYIKSYIDKSLLESYRKDIEYYGSEESDKRLNMSISINKPQGYSNCINEGIEIAKSVFDFLEVYLDYDESISIETENKNVNLISTDGCIVGGSINIDRENKKNYGCKDIGDGTDLKVKRMEQIGEIIFAESKNSVEEKLKFAWYWYVKAIKSKNKEEKLLYCWIALEKIADFDENFELEIMNKPKGAVYSKSEVVSKIVVPIMVLRKPINTMGKITSILNKLFRKNMNKKDVTNILEKLIKDKDKESINEYFNRFFKHIDEIKPYLNDIENEYIEEAKKFYFDREDGQKKLKQLRNSIEDDILNIYKLRNRIVHDAFITDDLINHYCIQCIKYTNKVINTITDIYLINKYQSINQVLIQLYKKYDSFFEKIKENNLIDLIDESYFE